MNDEKPAWWQPAIIMFARLSAWIAAPIIFAIYLGKWLDRKFNMEPFLFLFCVGAAFLISMFGIVRSALNEYKKIDSSADNIKENEKDNKNLK